MARSRSGWAGRTVPRGESSRYSHRYVPVASTTARNGRRASKATAIAAVSEHAIRSTGRTSPASLTAATTSV
jgi:hypothetical protein